MLFRPVLVIAAALSLSACVGLSLNTQERPFGKALDDFNAQTELNARLLGESPSLYANVNTTIIEGRVHLSGTVPTSEQRLTASRLAWETPHVVEVVNDIEVTEDTGLIDVARDRWISTQVRTRILTDGAIRDVNYTIDTQNRVVYVLGIAQSQSELDRVLAHARSVPEARRVVNYALLKDDPRRSFEPPGHYEDDTTTPPPEPVQN
ncbi:MAG: BON domain-containing protein [Alphaproteobacteria bacterium]|nr:BON domain-containing protein [Alphaproteobacteria bacterium]